jgi:hypothetical protein
MPARNFAASEKQIFSDRVAAMLWFVGDVLHFGSIQKCLTDGMSVLVGASCDLSEGVKTSSTQVSGSRFSACWRVINRLEDLSRYMTLDLRI